MENKKCVMIIVKKRVMTTLKDPVNIEFNEKENYVIVYDDNYKEIGKASFVQGDEYGVKRYKIELQCDCSDLDLYCYLVSKMCIHYDTLPTKYPLYIVLEDSQLEKIKVLSRIGFTPYLGDMKDQSEKENKEIWEAITQRLREQDK